MSHLVQIVPGVLFSSDVLSPDWGSKYRQDVLADDIIQNRKPV